MALIRLESGSGFEIEFDGHVYSDVQYIEEETSYSEDQDTIQRESFVARGNGYHRYVHQLKLEKLMGEYPMWFTEDRYDYRNIEGIVKQWTPKTNKSGKFLLSLEPDTL